MSILAKVTLPSGNEAVYEVHTLVKADGTTKTAEEIRWHEKHVATKFAGPNPGWHDRLSEEGDWKPASEENIARYESAMRVD